MSLEQRNKIFIESVAKNISQANNPSFATQYRRLVWARRTVELLLCAALVFRGLQFVLQNPHLPALWPASGVALSALFLRGNSVLLGIFIGTFCSYLYNHTPWIFCLLQSVLFIFYLIGIRRCSHQFIGTVIPLAQWQVLIKFFILVMLFSVMHSYLTLYLGTKFTFPLTTVQWIAASLGEINGVFCLTPLALLINPFTSKKYFQPRPMAWWLWGSLMVAGYFFYVGLSTGSITLITANLLLINLFWIIVLGIYAWQFGQIPSALTILGMSVSYLIVTPTVPYLWLFTLMIMSTLIIATLKKQQNGKAYDRR